MAKSKLLLLLVLTIYFFSSSAFVTPKRIAGVKKENLSIIAAAKETELGDSLGGNAKTAAAADTPKIGGTAETSKSKMKSNNLRWAIYGVATELFHNIVLRTLGRVRTRLFASKEQNLVLQNNGGQRYRQPPKHELAVVTGATGGIGSQIAHDLAFKGYDVVIAARDKVRGDALVKEIQGLLKVTPLKGEQSADEGVLPTISFVEYHADAPRSALDVASSIEGLGSPLSVLILNAGIMGKSKRLTMQVNLVGPAMLTFALLPLLAKNKAQSTIINVGSSAHLRATGVIAEQYLPTGESDGNKQSYLDSLPEVADDDLSTYAQSKLALMQFSTLLRHWLPKSKSSSSQLSIQILDAHPGLVWTPLLRNHIGDKAVSTLTKTGLAGLIYKSSSEGAQAIVSALDYVPTADGINKDQLYFVNGKPGGYAARESTSLEASSQLWKYVLAPEIEGVVDLPDGWGLVLEG